MSRILIVDEQPVTRHALRLMMEADRHEVVGEADNGPDALQQARVCKPDLMILELSIPRLGGLEVLQRLVAQESPVKVLVLTSQDSEYFAGRCLTAGASGFVSKQENPQAVREAVRAISQGHSYFPSHALGSVSAAEEAGHGELLKGLSVRELTVLQLLARGLSNIAIADQLAISDKTVSTYKVRLMQKLRAKSLVELIDIARRHGLVEGGAKEEEAVAAPAFDEEQTRELGLLRKMIDALPHPMTIRDLSSRILFCNQAALKILELSEEDVIGRFIVDLNMFADPAEGELLRQNMVASIGQGDPYSQDIELATTKGRKVYRHWGRPYRDEQGRLIGAICGSVDITDRDDLLRSLRSSNARIETVNRDKSHFLAGMASELQGPLQNIGAMIDLALNQPDPERRREPLQVAHSVASNLLNMLDDLQLLSRAESGRLELRLEALDLRQLIEQQVAAVRERAHVKGLKVETDFDLALKAEVWADSLRMRQLIGNLLSNAVKFTDHGSVLVRLRARGRGEGIVDVQIDVVDSGIGIPDEEQVRLFEPFARSVDGARILAGGTSLGLALCRSMVALMDGEMSLRSKQGVGTEVSVKLTFTGAES
ncbi:response regulator [Pseudomonas sp. PDNC002]|uniref:ATP-binding protein n=1 Tax=Pseudomonas sp. PDNC002 TaxID=2811422 RepID=UPI0019642207|nr:ATP-binding protein [Pseudomonas sp. PDNC002]QRY78441.1 response regulator [Pseudomonas sp. PDNC002]